MQPNLLSLIFLLNVLACMLLTGQTPQREIVWSKLPIGSNNERVASDLKLTPQIEVVELESIFISGESVSIGKPFGAADDWLKTLTFRVRNVSDEKLLKVQITLVLPELGLGSPDVVYCYGCSAVQKEKGLAPGEVGELKMPDGGFYDFIKSRIEQKLNLSQLRKAEIHHIYVTPPNGPTWFSGCVKTTNPKDACPHHAP